MIRTKANANVNRWQDSHLPVNLNGRRDVMKKQALRIFGGCSKVSILPVLALCTAIAVWGQTPPTIITFDVPGAGTAADQGTLAASINPAGMIAGTYIDANGVGHGFLRAPGGSFTPFDAPGGASIQVVAGINPAGMIAGA